MRRAVGREGVTALAEHEQTIGALANSNQLAHKRLDNIDTVLAAVRQDVRLLPRLSRLDTVWGRLWWLVMGR